MISEKEADRRHVRRKKKSDAVLIFRFIGLEGWGWGVGGWAIKLQSGTFCDVLIISVHSNQ